MAAIISGIGAYYPEKVLSNSDLEKIVDTTDEWITTRTGIKQRRILPEESDMNASDLGARAAAMALEQAGLGADQLDGIICAGINPDMLFPATACIIQKKIGAGGFGFDLTAACAGFVCGVNVATALINDGQCRNILVVGAELLSRVMDWKDRNTCILFGDAAGAVVMSACEEEGRGVLNSCMKSDGRLMDILYLNNAVNKKSDSFIHMEGKAVFKTAVQSLSDVVRESLDREGLTVQDLDLAVFHQANVRILSAVGRKLRLPDEKVPVNVSRYGNTSSASIPLVLHECHREGRLKPGMLVTLAAIGGGMTWGCNLIRW
ncbi:beta-ketoacyl-ACP synthase III [Fibrobacterota bacterium]